MFFSSLAALSARLALVGTSATERVKASYRTSSQNRSVEHGWLENTLFRKITPYRPPTLSHQKTVHCRGLHSFGTCDTVGSTILFFSHWAAIWAHVCDCCERGNKKNKLIQGRTRLQRSSLSKSSLLFVSTFFSSSGTRDR